MKRTALPKPARPRPKSSQACRHAGLARQLEKLLDLLKPQNRMRIRFQEEGSELDLDVAIRSLIDWRAGAQPDPRILMSHHPDSRSIAVMVLLDLSQSLNDVVPGTTQTRLALSTEAVAVLAWAIDRLGDPFALAGFHSNTWHDVRYQHIKGFGETWGKAHPRPGWQRCKASTPPAWAQPCAMRPTTWARKSWRSKAYTATASAWTRRPTPTCTTFSASTPP